MILLFIFLELIANFAYHQSLGTVTEFILHLLLSVSLFGAVRVIGGRKLRLVTALNVIILIICLFAYLISYQTEKALGAPLQLENSFAVILEDSRVLVPIRNIEPAVG